MNSINLSLLRSHVEDAEARAKEDRPDAKREPKNKWSAEALQKNDRFKDRIFEIMMRRAKDFYIDTNQEARPEKLRYTKATVTVVIWEDLVHPGMEAMPEFSFVDRDGTQLIPNEVAGIRGKRPLVSVEAYDSPETVQRIEAINSALSIGCGPPRSEDD